MEEFTYTLSHHPFWKLHSTIRTIEDGLEQPETLVVPDHKSHIVTLLTAEPKARMLYRLIKARSNKDSISLSLAQCLNDGCQGLMNNNAADEGWKEVYLDILSEKTKIHKDLIDHYYTIYQELMHQGKIKHDKMLDNILDQISKALLG